MKQWIAKIETVDDSMPISVRVKITIRNGSQLNTRETIFPKKSALYSLLKETSKPVYALLRASRNRNAPIHFVRTVEPQSW